MPVFSDIFKTWISEMLIFPKFIFPNAFGFPLVLGGVLVSPKRNNLGFGAHRKSRNHENDRGVGFYHDEIEKLLVQNKAE